MYIDEGCLMYTELPVLPPGVQMLELPPLSRRTRNHLPRWAVWLGQDQIGLIEQWRVDSAAATFYRATGFHPVTREEIRLESSTDLRERVDKVVACWHDPVSFVPRWSWD